MEVNSTKVKELIKDKMKKVFHCDGKLELKSLCQISWSVEENFRESFDAAFSRYSLDSICSLILEADASKETESIGANGLNETESSIKTAFEMLFEFRRSVKNELDLIEKRVRGLLEPNPSAQFIEDFSDGLLNDDDTFAFRLMFIAQSLSAQIFSEKQEVTTSNLEILKNSLQESKKVIQESLRQLKQRISSIGISPKQVVLAHDSFFQTGNPIKNILSTEKAYFEVDNDLRLLVHDALRNCKIVKENRVLRATSMKVKTARLLEWKEKVLLVYGSDDSRPERSIYLMKDVMSPISPEYTYKVPLDWSEMVDACIFQKNTLVALFNTAYLVLIDLENDKVIQNFQITREISDFSALCPFQNEEMIFLANDGRLILQELGLVPKMLRESQKIHWMPINTLRLSQSGQHLLSASDDCHVSITDQETMKTLWKREVGGISKGAEWSQNQLFVVAISSNNSVYFLSASSGEIQLKYQIEQLCSPCSLAVNWKHNTIRMANVAGVLFSLSIKYF